MKLKSVQSLLTKLIGFDTTSHKSNRDCIAFIQNYLDNLGIKSEIIANDVGNKACLWATVGPQEKAGIVLAGHTDVVPVDGQTWTSDPFTLTERNEKLFGRGACDMKGFIACVLVTIAECDREKLLRPLHLAFTYDEEISMEGAERLTNYLKNQKVKPAWVWIGEPTELHIVHAHKGVAAYLTNFTGVPAHSAQPDQGLNAISLGAEFIDIIQHVAEQKKSNPFSRSRFIPPYTTFNLGTIKGGTAENIIAEHCELLWQIRSHPGEEAIALLAEVEAMASHALNPRLAKFPNTAAMRTCTCFDIPPLMPTQDNPGEKTLARLTGRDEFEAVSFATEAGFFQKLGTHVVVCGPGSIDQAHKADEYIAKTEIIACMGLLKQMLEEKVM